MKSWKTTVAAIVAALALIIPQVQAFIDDDPETKPDITIILAALGIGFGGTSARDNGVSSEAAGAK